MNRLMRNTLLLIALMLALVMIPTLALASELSLTTIYDTDNSQSGIMFDIVAKSAIRLDRLDSNIADGTYTIEIYTRSGTHLGFEDSPDGWDLVGTATITSAGDNQPTPIPIDLSSIVLSAGERQALYVTTTVPHAALMLYTNGTSPEFTTGNLFVEDDNLQIFEGTGKSYAFDPWGNFQPRIWNGTIYYNLEPHDLTVEAGAGGAVSTAGGEYTAGEPITVAATANPGYYFVGWTVTGIQLSDITANPLSFTMPDNDVVLVANFVAEANVDIYYLATEGGRVTREHESIAPATGAPTGSTAIADVGFEFIGWVDATHEEYETIISVDEHFIPSRNENGVYTDAIYVAVFLPLDEIVPVPPVAPTIPAAGDSATLWSMALMFFAGCTVVVAVLGKRQRRI